MQTNFSPEQLKDPSIREVDGILRSCVHCGFCTATCPTFVLLGDERDSPRGRIYLMKDMLEKDRPATEQDVRHIDRCLSCLACMTTCPSDVHYMHLVDHARAHIERTYDRPLADRLVRSVLAAVLPYPRRFRVALLLARLGRPLASLVLPSARKRTDVGGDEAHRSSGPGRLPALVNRGRTVAPTTSLTGRLGAMLSLAPNTLPRSRPVRRPAVYAPEGGDRVRRVAILSGCAQSVLAPSINEAAIRVLNRAGVEVVVPRGEGCCGALVHHMGKERAAHADAKANIDAWWREIEGDGLDAIAITTSGCGTTIKDYGFMLRDDPDYADKAARVSSLAHGYLGAPHRGRSGTCRAPPRGPSCLPQRVLHAARPENYPRTESAPSGCRLFREGCARGAPVLRICRHLQHHAAGDRDAAEGPQAREYRPYRGRSRGNGKHRLHDPAFHRCASGRPYRGASGLGARWPSACGSVELADRGGRHSPGLMRHPGRRCEGVSTRENRSSPTTDGS